MALRRVPDSGAKKKDQPGFSFRREFQFIDNKDKLARKKGRTHVTKEYYRELRWKQIHAKESPPPVLTKSTEITKPKFVVSVTKLQELAGASADSSTDAPLAGCSPSRDAKNEGADPSDISRRLDLHITAAAQPSPNSILGAGRIDPFQTYPVQATWDIHRLVDHYHRVIPSLLHKHWGRQITHPMPIMDLFEVYRQDPVSFLGMLHHAAHHLAKMRGPHTETAQVVGYKYQTLKLLNTRLASSSGPHSDGTIVGVGLLANAERIWGDKEVSRMHWGAVKRMILDRGGFPAFKENHLLHTKLVWSFIALSGVSPAGNPAYIDTFSESIADVTDENGSQAAFHRSCDEFVDFVARRKIDAIKAVPTSQADREHQAGYPMRSKSFRPGTRMYHALREVETGYSSPEKRRAVDNCRLACLLHLNAVVFDYGDFSKRTETFLENFSRFVEDDDFDCSLSSEHLLWALIRGIEREPANERVWMVSRMMGVLKRAEQKTWVDVEEALRLFLIMPEDGSELMARLAAWDTESVRREIMSFADHVRLPAPDCSAIDLQGDFLPETRDAQWFPQSAAANEGGVPPHPKFTSVSVRDCLEGDRACNASCEICKLKPVGF